MDELFDYPATQDMAARLGYRRYYTGRPCVRGHLGLRYTMTGGCCQCNAEASKRKRDEIRKLLGTAAQPA
jgi:hypothetical protein